MARGRGPLRSAARVPEEFPSAMRALSPILPAVGIAGSRSCGEPSAARWHHGSAHRRMRRTKPFLRELRTSRDLRRLCARTVAAIRSDPPQTLSARQSELYAADVGRTGRRYGEITLSAGTPYGPRRLSSIPISSLRSSRPTTLRAQQAQNCGAAASALPQNLALAQWVWRRKTSVCCRSSGRYRVARDRRRAFGPDVSLRYAASLAARYARRIFPQNLSATLPYVFGGGVGGDVANPDAGVMVSRRSTVYQWQRGDPSRGFSSRASARARLRSRRSRRCARAAFDADQPAASRRAHDRRGERSKRSQTQRWRASAAVAAVRYAGSARRSRAGDRAASRSILRPGWNDVAFVFSSATAASAATWHPTLSRRRSHPDLSFTRVGGSGASMQPLRDDSFARARSRRLPSRLAGDPDFVGNVGRERETAIFGLAVALAGPAAASSIGSFPLARTVRSTSTSSRVPERLERCAERDRRAMAVVARRAVRGSTDLHYSVHALPALERRAPAGARRRRRFSIDGRPIGAATGCTFARTATSSRIADRNIKIGLVDDRTGDAPADAAVWASLAATLAHAIDVTAAANAARFCSFSARHTIRSGRHSVGVVPPRHVVVNGVSNGWIVPSLPSGGKIHDLCRAAVLRIAAAISAIALLIMIVLASAPSLGRAPVRPLNSALAWALRRALRVAAGSCVVALILAMTFSGETAGALRDGRLSRRNLGGRRSLRAALPSGGRLRARIALRANFSAVPWYSIGIAILLTVVAAAVSQPGAEVLAFVACIASIIVAVLVRVGRSPRRRLSRALPSRPSRH